MSEVLPLLYLHGLSTSDFAPALEQCLGTGHGLSASTVGRRTTQWQDDARAFAARLLAEVNSVPFWVDGIPRKVRLEHDKVCLLVMIGVRADGSKEPVALADGCRESSESGADLLRDDKRRGGRAPTLAIGDGALGFWKAIRDVFPETVEQRCWRHKIGNVLAALPKSADRGRNSRTASSSNEPTIQAVTLKPHDPPITDLDLFWCQCRCLAPPWFGEKFLPAAGRLRSGAFGAGGSGGRKRPLGQGASR